ncbi:MAG: gamma-glutamyl-gamma-aminobutyrate hydrolase family protein, partial [Chloroflexota bacterium]|nr:gamma-glutamyl-gamma-aminobutyrate hydrolase family protein [Chloroflexota bacterium]
PYMIAVQWHPERAPQDERHMRLFRALVAAARERNGSG